MDNLHSIIGDYQVFLKQILQEIKSAGFDLGDFVQMDHICYRVSSIDLYEAKKKELTIYGKLLSEARVSGRPIATFRLYEPIRYENWRIDAIELPAPKEGVITKEGLEHVELVLFDDKEDFLKKYAHKQFDMKAADRGVNPEIGFKLPSYTVKFHLLSLPAAVYLQNKLQLTDI